VIKWAGLPVVIIKLTKRGGVHSRSFMFIKHFYTEQCKSKTMPFFLDFLLDPVLMHLLRAVKAGPSAVPRLHEQ